MDTTETYIKMCEKATEIQVYKKPETNGFDVQSKWLEDDIIKYPQGRVGIFRSDWFIPGTHFEQYIWLPRQDQLQEMIEDKTRPAWALGEWFGEWCQSLRRTIDNAFASMEQLWLAFVMKEKYGKIWNGQDWQATDLNVTRVR